MDKQSESQYRNLEDSSWFPFSDEPILNSLSYVRCFSEPFVLLPQDSCDGKWHMFFHSWIGIHHFVSDSGISWIPRKMIEVGGRSPFLYQEKENYYLVYEKEDKFNLNGKVKNSRIEIKSSTDLITWSKPRVLLEAKDIPFASDYVSSPKISGPQIIKLDKKYRLYFGASEVTAPDTKLKFARYFSYAECSDLQGKYQISEASQILIEPVPDDKYSNLGVGKVRVVQLDDSFYAFRCSLFWDNDKSATSSHLFMLKSTDGLNWEHCKDKPLLVTSSCGWTDTYIKSCDIHYSDEERSWYCYYSAYGKEREAIGLLMGCVPIVFESKNDRLRTVLASFFG